MPRQHIMLLDAWRNQGAVGRFRFKLGLTQSRYHRPDLAVRLQRPSHGMSTIFVGTR